jgi:hypothetical protein
MLADLTLIGYSKSPQFSGCGKYATESKIHKILKTRQLCAILSKNRLIIVFFSENGGVFTGIININSHTFKKKIELSKSN